MNIYQVNICGEDVASHMFKPSCYAIPFSTKGKARAYIANRIMKSPLHWRIDTRGEQWSTRDNQNCIYLEKMILDDVNQ